MTLVCLAQVLILALWYHLVRSFVHVHFVDLDLHLSDIRVMSVIKALRTSLSKDNVFKFTGNRINLSSKKLIYYEYNSFQLLLNQNVFFYNKHYSTASGTVFNLKYRTK